MTYMLCIDDLLTGVRVEWRYESRAALLMAARVAAALTYGALGDGNEERYRASVQWHNKAIDLAEWLAEC